MRCARRQTVDRDAQLDRLAIWSGPQHQMQVARSETAGLARRRMANLMVGRDVSDMFPDKITVPADAPIALKVEGLAVPDWVEDLSSEVRAGEVLGFAGLVGAGRTEAFEAIIGLRKRTAGRIEIAGRRADLKSPRDAMRHGLTYLGEDRKGKGLHVNLSRKDKVTLMTLERHAHPLLDMKEGRAALTKAVSEFGIRTGDLSSRARMLPGGQIRLSFVARARRRKEARDRCPLAQKTPNPRLFHARDERGCRE
ncbi:ABC-type sugar transport system ATPase subunit [Paraburkholderia sp. GAS32]